MEEIQSTAFDTLQADVDAGIKNRVWKVFQQPVGVPVLGKDVAFIEEPVPSSLKKGFFLVRAQFLSVDPYHRGKLNAVSYGVAQEYPRVMHGQVVGKVVQISDGCGVEVGDLVSCYTGYQDYGVTSLKHGAKKLDHSGGIFEKLPLSYALGVLGMPGATAYHGFLDICTPKEGETVAVSAATGAVGSLVGQIAKLKGCKVIGFAGSAKKCEYAKSILGYDACLLYKGQTTDSLSAAIKEVAPEGIDCYFDNTGGVCTNAVQLQMNKFGRISVCGQIAYYNDPKPMANTFPFTLSALSKQLKIQGFIIPDLAKDWSSAHTELAKWLVSGEITYKEDLSIGTENSFNAFLSLFRRPDDEEDSSAAAAGSLAVNFGKKIVQFY